MLPDKQNLLSDQQSLILGAPGNILSTHSIDLGVAQAGPLGTPVYDIGRGQTKKLLAQITDAVLSGAAATVQLQLITGTGVDGNGQINAGIKVIAQTEAIGKAELVPGYKFRLGCIPHGIDQRYLGVRFVVGGAATTAGKATVGIVHDVDTFSI